MTSKINSKLITIITVFVACFVYYVRHIERSPIVRTSTGNVQGLVATSRNGRKFNLFLGIPFAQPPVGTLRFASPQPVQSWNGTLDATVHGPECKGFDFFFVGRIQGEESCLFLNVYSPEGAIANVSPTFKKLLPVIVHIHGGGFHTASTQKYDGKYFMDHDVVLVTIQYRLGIFGFLNADDETARGNMGLKDQVLALKWVQKNVMQFGGDPNQVTVMGESAGGTSVHLLMLSPMAKGLFHRAVTMGIEGTSELWQYNHSNSDFKNVIAEHFNCPKESPKFVQCMREIDDETLASYHSHFVKPEVFNNSAGLGPSIERFGGPDAFLTDNPLTLLKNGNISNKVPWIVGVNDNEGLLLLGMLLRFMEAKDIVTDKNWEKYLPHLLFYDKSKRPDASIKIKQKYFGGSDLQNLDEAEIIKILGEMVTDKMFFKPVVESAKLHAKSAPVYLYFYTHKGFLTLFNFIRWASPTSFLLGELSIGFKFVQHAFYKYILQTELPHFGSAHGDDILLMFQLPLSWEIVVNNFDLQMSQLLVKTYVDFATFEKPAFQGLEWPDVNASETLACMELNTRKPVVLKDPFSSRIKFWDDLNLPHT